MKQRMTISSFQNLLFPLVQCRRNLRSANHTGASGLSATLVLALLAASFSVVWLAPTVNAGGASSAVPGFGREVIVDHQRISAESPPPSSGAA
jgi:hypothetical protein